MLKKLNQAGILSGLAVSFGIADVLLVVAIIFGIWAFAGRQDYKNHADAKIQTAVAAATAQQTKTDAAQYAIDQEKPLRTYNGPEAYGSLVVQYPKTWSAYVDTTDAAGANNGPDIPVNGYFAPDTVPSVSDANAVFALRVEVVNQAYAQTAAAFAAPPQTDQDQPITPPTITPYSLPNLPKVIGIEVQGMLPDGKNGTLIALPLRSETLEIWTDGTQYLSDFNNNILKNFSFSP